MKEWGRVKGASAVCEVGAGDVALVLLGCVRGGCSHQGSRGGESGRGQARLPRHVFALVVRA